MYLNNSHRSKCCYAPIKLGKKKIKNSSITLNVWVCTRCKKKDVDIVEYSKDGPPKSTPWSFDTEEPDLLE